MIRVSVRLLKVTVDALLDRAPDRMAKQVESSIAQVEGVTEATILADTDDWFELLKTYHEPVLGWVGGTLKVEGREADEAAVEDRLKLIRHSLDVIFGGRNTFRCCWTYIRAVSA